LVQDPERVSRELDPVDSLEQLVMDRTLMLAAGDVDPPGIRMLDAIHLVLCH